MMNIRNTLRGKDGVALLTVVLIFLVMVIMVAGMSVWSMGNMTNSKVSNEHTAAFYAAEAGINTFMSNLDLKITELIGTDENPISPPANEFFDLVTEYVNNNSVLNLSLSSNNGELTNALVTIQVTNNILTGTRTITLVSTGTVGDITRVLEKSISLNYSEGTDGDGFTTDKAVLTLGYMQFGNNSKVYAAKAGEKAPIGSYMTVKDALNYISFGNSGVLIDEIQLPKGADATLIGSTHIDKLSTTKFIDTTQLYPDIGMPEVLALSEYAKLPPVTYGSGGNAVTFINSTTGSMTKTSSNNFTNVTYTIPQLPQKPGGGSYAGYYVPSMSFQGTNNFTIHTNNDIFILTDRLFITGHLRITGSGKVTIFVRGKTFTNFDDRPLSFPTSPSETSNGAILGRTDMPQNLMIFLGETYQVVSGKNEEYNVLFANNAIFGGSLYFKNTGLILQNNASIDGYYVTGAKSVVINNGGTVGTTLFYAPNAHFHVSNGSIRGAIITNTFSIANNGEIIYDPLAFSDFPFQILDPVTGGGIANKPRSLSLLFGPTIEQ